MACWCVLSMDELCLATFAFRLFDEDDSGPLNATYVCVLLCVRVHTYASVCVLSLCKSIECEVITVTTSVRTAGELSALELQEVVQICCGNDPNTMERMKKEFTRMDKNNDGIVSLDEFKCLVRACPILLFPAFEMRDILRNTTLGSAKWKQVAKLRNDKFKDKSMDEILECLTVKPTCYYNKTTSFNRRTTDKRSEVALECYNKRRRRDSKTSEEKKKKVKDKAESKKNSPSRKNSAEYHMKTKASAY